MTHLKEEAMSLLQSSWGAPGHSAQLETLQNEPYHILLAAPRVSGR